MTDDRNTPFDIRHMDRLVGVFFVGALIIVLVAFFLRQQGTGEFERKLNYYTVLSRSYGIAAGADVTLSGITIGKIRSVELQSDGTIRVELDLFGKYEEFVTEGSELEVAPGLALPAVLGGGGLIFLYNKHSDKQIKVDSFIPTFEPMELTDVIKQLNLPVLAEKIKSIVANAEEISLKLKQEQGALFSTLTNLERLTEDLAVSSRTMPALLATFEQSIPAILSSMERSLAGLRHSMDTMEGVVAGSEVDIRTLIKKAHVATVQLAEAATELNTLLAGMKHIVKAVDAGSDRIPGIITASEELIQNSTELTDKLNRHWLLGGKKEQGFPGEWPTVHRGRRSLYDEALSEHSSR